MIQRQQTLWLLLAVICSFLSFKFPFYTGQLKDGLYSELEAGSSFFLLILTGASILFGLIAIFMFKDRKTQLKLTIGCTILSVIILIIYFAEMGKFAKGSIAISCLFVLLTIAGYVMATRGIWKDEKLIKSLDKLR